MGGAALLRETVQQTTAGQISAAAVEVGLLLVYLIGVWLLFGSSFRGIAEQWRAGKRLRAGIREAYRKQSPVKIHLDMLAQVAVSPRISGNMLLTATGALFAAVLLTGLRTLSPAAAAAVALAAASTPYLLLRMRLETIRKKVSQEGERFVAGFLSAYRITGGNVYAAMEQMTGKDGKIKLSRNLLSQMLLEMRSTGSSAGLREAADKFSFALSTNWGRMLSYNLWASAVSGINVSVAIEDILVQLREARTLREERKRMNGEAARMTLFLVPALYLFTLLMARQTMGITIAGFLANQFLTPQGFLLFAAALLLFLVNIVILQMVNNQRFDF